MIISLDDSYQLVLVNTRFTLSSNLVCYAIKHIHHASGNHWFLTVRHDSKLLSVLTGHSPSISFSNSSMVVSNGKWSSNFSFSTSISGLYKLSEVIWVLLYSCWVIFMASQSSILFRFKDLLHRVSTSSHQQLLSMELYVCSYVL